MSAAPDCYPWNAERDDGTGPAGVCLTQAEAVAALTEALHNDVEPGVEGVVHAADIDLTGPRDAGYVYRDQPLARAYRDADTGAIVWTKQPEPEPAQ